MKKTFFAMLAGVSLMLGACSPTYDKDKPHTENREAMLEGMSESEKDAFEQALETICKSCSSEQEALDAIHGKTVEEIMEMADNATPCMDVAVSVSGATYSAPSSSSSGRKRSSGPRYDASNPVESKKAMESNCSPAKMKEVTRAMEKLYKRHGMRVTQVIDGLTVDEIIELAN